MDITAIIFGKHNAVPFVCDKLGIKLTAKSPLWIDTRHPTSQELLRGLVLTRVILTCGWELDRGAAAQYAFSRMLQGGKPEVVSCCGSPIPAFHPPRR